MKSQDLLNSKEVKAYILRMIEETRPGWNCNRVSAKALNIINAKLKFMICGAVQRHASKGRTFLEVQ